ncbi:MAG: tetratricopeptide repeat protein, partial [Acidobacteria bacterium]|nr:tetratricopeptide repeat protein [Acidobacteriota bacterium]
AALAEDLERALSHRPVRARSETRGYRLAKLVRRHPYGSTATAALFLAVAMGVASTLRATWQARSERDRAQVSQSEAERVTDFLVDLFEVASPEVSPGKEVSAKEVLDRGAELIEGELAEQPLSRARLLQAMGRAYHGLGLYDSSRRLYEEATADRESVLGARDPEVAAGLLDLARTQLNGGDYQGARTLLERCLQIYTDAGESQGPGAASAQNLLAHAYQLQGDAERAEATYREALAIRASQLGPDHLDTLETLNNLGEVLVARHQLDEAEELFRRALEGRRRQLPSTHPAVVLTLNNVGVVQLEKGNLPAAEATFREVLEARRRLYGESHPHVALAYNNLGQVLSLEGKHEESGKLLEKALALSLELYGEGHPRVADLLYSLGLELGEQGRLPDAETRLASSLEKRRASLGEQHPSVAQSLVALADLHQRMGRTGEALDEARQSLAILDAALPRGDYRRSSPLILLGRLLASQGRCREALPYLDQAVELRRSFLPEDHPALRDALTARDRCSPGGRN